jgi:hypothetical protein
MGSRQAPFFHERIAARENVETPGTRVSVVLLASGHYEAATERTDGLGEVWVVYDAGTGHYRLNDAALGAASLAYFSGSNTVML